MKTTRFVALLAALFAFSLAGCSSTGTPNAEQSSRMTEHSATGSASSLGGGDRGVAGGYGGMGMGGAPR